MLRSWLRSWFSTIMYLLHCSEQKEVEVGIHYNESETNLLLTPW